jgi:hypothetical protein
LTSSPAPTLRFNSRVGGAFSVPNDSSPAVFFNYERDSAVY